MTGENPGSATIVNVSEILDETEKQIPDVAPGGKIPEAEPEPIQEAPKPGELVDIKGRTFDPALHVVNPDGTPKLTKTGKLRVNPLAKASDKQKEAAKPPEVLPDFSPEMIVGIVTGACMMVLGPDWQPEEQESVMLTQATRRYCEAHGVGELSPGWTLLAVAALYAAPRLYKPETQKRLKPIMERVKDGWTALWLKFKYRKGFKHAQPDNRFHDERQDNSGKTDGRKLVWPWADSPSTRPAS